MLRCDFDECDEGVGGPGYGFDDKKALFMHLGMQHGTWRCTVRECEFESNKSDDLKEHRATQHGISAPQRPTPRVSGFEGVNNVAKEKPTGAKKSGFSKKSAPSKSVESDEDDLFVRDRDSNEFSGEVYACTNPDCMFTHESEEEVLRHKELKHGPKGIESSPNANQRRGSKAVSKTGNQIQKQGGARSGAQRGELTPFRKDVANKSSSEASKISKPAEHKQSRITSALEAAGMPPPRKRPAAKIAEPVDTPVTIVTEKNRVKARRPVATPSPRAPKMIKTAARGVGFTPKPLSAQAFARMALANQGDDPKPIPRSFPSKSKRQVKDLSDDDGDESPSASDSESDEDDYDTGSEDESLYSNDSDLNPPKAKRVKRAGAADQDQFEAEMSDGISDAPTPATSRRPRVSKAVSKRARLEAFHSNPYANDPSLQRGSAAGFRRDILLDGVPVCQERQEAIDGLEPPGHIDEETDFDEGLAFPRPNKAESALMTKMKKHTQEFVRQRDMEPEPIRMVFTSSLDINEIMKSDTETDAVVVDTAEAVTKPKHRKLGSRSKLGPQVPKRKYTWSDETRNKRRKAASATATADADGAMDTGTVPVAGDLSGSVGEKSEGTVGGAEGAGPQQDEAVSDANAIPAAARPASSPGAPSQ